MSCSRRRSNKVLWAWIKRRWLSQGRLKVDRWEMEADRQHIYRETKAHRIERKKKLMKYIKQWQKALLGTHNVKSNQADWQFGSCSFSRLCLLLLWPNQKASQMTLIVVAKKVPITTAYSLCNLLRQRHAVNTCKLSNSLVFFSFWSLFLVFCCQFDSLASSGLAVIMVVFVILTLTPLSWQCAAITSWLFSWACPYTRSRPQIARILLQTVGLLLTARLLSASSLLLFPLKELLSATLKATGTSRND